MQSILDMLFGNKKPDEVLAELEKLSQGLLLMSESDYPFEVAAIPAGTDVTEALRHMASHDWENAETVSIDQLLGFQATRQTWHSAEDAITADRFAALKTFIEEHFHNLVVYKVGRVNRDVFVVGELADGSHAVLCSKVVET